MKKPAPPDDISLAFYISGGVLLCVAIFLRIYCARRRRRYHSPLDVEQITISENIARRKRDLGRYIDTLQKQLDARKQQLEMHDRVEQVLTARQEMTDESHGDPRWKEIMERGKAMYGDEWENGKEGELPLGVLMSMHKEELLATARPNLPDELDTSDQKLKRSIERLNQATLVQHAFVLETARREKSAAVLPVNSQWKSQRRLGTSSVKQLVQPLPASPPSAPSQSGPALDAKTDCSWSKHRFARAEAIDTPARTSRTASPPSIVPQLNFSRLTPGPNIGKDPNKTIPSVKDILKSQW
ncbi:Aste57867_9550 [Aphanomyces stellatus]|uniref:Aste57867_9550 protein n=1 Tax=Aphanomyces stellatus TaxID=120398 RepID=A0A485KNJ6_9STRA|nr:hypothetical protein As57867_009513 [Aphanomyces stellatus]VFT86429.1 Aste57867_9550 [Aphanomyces stellatus]